MRATLELDGAPVTLLPRRAPVGNSGPIRGRSLTVFPCHNRGPDAPHDADGLRAHVRAALPRPDAVLVPAVVQPGDVPGLAVFDLTPDEALAAGRTLNVAALLHWDGRRAALLP